MLTNSAGGRDGSIDERARYTFLIPFRSMADPAQALSSDAFRVGGVYERVSADGREISLIDLYRSKAKWCGLSRRMTPMTVQADNRPVAAVAKMGAVAQ